MTLSAISTGMTRSSMGLRPEALEFEGRRRKTQSNSPWPSSAWNYFEIFFLGTNGPMALST